MLRGRSTWKEVLIGSVLLSAAAVGGSTVLGICGVSTTGGGGGRGGAQSGLEVARRQG
jgi:hypothetical protein